MKRVLALAGAIFLIAAAIVVRAVIADDDDESVGTDGGDDGDLVVACIPELREACEAIDRDMDLRIEDPGDTIAALAEGDYIDAWVTLDPWPEMAEILERRQFFGEVEVVGASDLVLLARTTEIPDACGANLGWTCLVDGLGDRVAVADRSGALGALVFGWAAEEFFPNLIRADIVGDAQLAQRLEVLDTLSDPIGDIFAFAAAGPHATATTNADLGQRFDGSREDPNFTRSVGASPAAVAVVVAGRRADRIAGQPSFTDALDELGWDLDPGAATGGLPNAGVLVALSQEVSS